jgi:ribosomal protein S15P/S13E
MLTEKEIQTAKKLKQEFGQIKDQINLVEEQMKSLNQTAESLIKHLEDLRLQEKNFVQNLQKKYGEGNLNPITFTYEKL